MAERTLALPEIDHLLSLFRGGDTEFTEGLPVESYELDTPSRVPRAAMEGVIIRHEQAARALKHDLATLLNREVDVALESCEQVRFGALRESLPEPSCCFLVELAPLREPAFCVVDYPLAFASVDRLLGGSGDPAGDPRDLTSTELAMLEDVMRVVMQAHVAAWQPYTTLKAKLLRAVSIPRYVRDLRAEDIMLVTRYRLQEFAPGAVLTFAVPLMGLEPHLQHEPRPVAPSQNKVSYEADIAAHLGAVRIPIAVRLGGARLPLRDLIALEVDDVIVLDRLIHEGCELVVAGSPKYDGAVGTHGGNFTFRVGAARARTDAAAAAEKKRKS